MSTTITTSRESGGLSRTMTRAVGFVLFTLSACFAIACEVLDPNPGPEPVGPGAPIVDTSGPEPRIDTIPPSVDRGKVLFLQNCSRCHGIDASGTIYSRGSIQGKKGLHLIVRQGRGGMPAFPDLSTNEIASIELWLGTFDVGLSEAGGEELFLFYCASCHGADGRGASTFGGSIQGYVPIGPIVRNGTGAMPAIDLPAAQIDSIQAFLALFQVDLRALSGTDYFAHVCAGCHGRAGEGSDRGPEVRNPVAPYAEHVVRNGRSGNRMFTRTMPRFASDTLGREQLDEIIAWLGAVEKPFDGESLYNRFCSTCHGFDGRGGPSEKKIYDVDIDEFFTMVRGGNGGSDYGSRRAYMPAWSPSELSDDEIRRIAAWITR